MELGPKGSLVMIPMGLGQNQPFCSHRNSLGLMDGSSTISGWWFQTWIVLSIYGIIPTPLTNSYCSRWVLYHQPDKDGTSSNQFCKPFRPIPSLSPGKAKCGAPLHRRGKSYSVVPIVFFVLLMIHGLWMFMVGISNGLFLAKTHISDLPTFF